MLFRSVTWSYYDESGNKTIIKSEIQVNKTSIPLQNNSSLGYELDIQGELQYVWVFHYPDFEVQLDDIQIDTNTEDRCQFVQAQLFITANSMKYQGYNQQTMPYEVVRTFELAYDSAYFSQTTYEVESVVRKIEQTSYVQLTSPLMNTLYTLSGDQFARAFNRTKEISSAQVEAFAVQINPTASIQTRDGLNEKERDLSSSQTLRGSAPLEVEVLSYANVPAARYFDWCLSREAEDGRAHV